MRPALVLSAVAWVFTSACTSETSPSCVVDGDWSWDGNNNPGGSSLYLSLTSLGDSVFGTGSATGIGPSSVVDSISTSGRFIPDFATLGLTLNYHSGRIVTYVAVLGCPSSLQGTATENGRTWSLAFHR